jgi:hypothetical protein
MSTTAIALLVVLGVMVILYSIKRRGRLNKEDAD